MSSLTIIVVDDHPMFRQGVCGLVGQLSDTCDIEQAGEMKELNTLLKRLRPPDLLVLDVMFPGFDPAHDLAALRKTLATTVIVVVSMIEDNALIDRLLSEGINGFIAKSVSPETMLEGFHRTLDGETVIYRPDIIPGKAPASALDKLSPRQSEVLVYLAKGLSNKEIAKEMSLSPFTVRVHVSALLSTLGVRSRSAAAAIAAKAGLD